MINVITEETKLIKSWVTDLEESELAQARNVANLPFLHKHIALMPDSQRCRGRYWLKLSEDDFKVSERCPLKDGNVIIKLINN